MTTTPKSRELLTPEDTRLAMEAVMGKLPGDDRRVPLQVEELSRADDARGFERRHLRFVTEPGDSVSAWLLIPHTLTLPAPAMLCLHQTVRCGKDEPVGLGGSADLHYAAELAARGYICLAPDYPGYGENRCDPYQLGYASATMKGIWNHLRALDLLDSLPQVDRGRIGVIGHSLGAHNALVLAAYDERVRLVVSSCGFTRFTWNDNEGRGKPGDLTDWSHAGYMPRLASVYGCRVETVPFDWPDVLGTVAPRPLFINAPTRDFFQAGGVDECVDLVQHLYAQAPESLVVMHPDAEHSFPPAVQEAAYSFIDQHLATYT